MVDNVPISTITLNVKKPGDEERITRGCIAIKCPSCGAEPLQACIDMHGKNKGKPFGPGKFGVPIPHYMRYAEYRELEEKEAK